MRTISTRGWGRWEKEVDDSHPPTPKNPSLLILSTRR
jgi:hypothetical protein